MPVRYPRPLRPGDRVGVTSPSSGVDGRLRPRLDVAVRAVEAQGYDVVVGACMDGSRHVSAPAPERAAELTAMLCDPAIRAIVPPWGGETAIDLLSLLDWEAIRAAEPTWVVGFSDMSTVITPLTLLTGTATVHGNNLMDTPYEVPDGLVGWLDVVTTGAGESFTQTPPNRHRSSGWVDYAEHPEDHRLVLDGEGRWTRLDDDDPVVVEASADEALEICRNLHGMRLAGFFDAANAVLVGRTNAPDSQSLTQQEAVLDALGGLGVPVIADVECGHVPPHLPLVNGALARLTWTPDGSGDALTQTLT